jgi:hypothetical protein
MIGFVIGVIAGIICAVIGVVIMRGNASLIHSYHQSRVSKENMPTFLKIIGAGVTTVGGAISLFCLLAIKVTITSSQLFIILGYISLIFGIISGLLLIIYALIRYNKGIF